MTFNVATTTGNSLEGFVLLRPAALTHHFDPDQRYIELEQHTIVSTQTGGTSTTYTISVPAPTSDLGPQGWYMLFAIESNGIQRVPSIGWFVRIT